MQTFTGLEYLMIDIANSFGKDKLTWDERIAWFKENYPNLNPDTADEPCMAYAGLEAFKDVLEGKPSGYLLNLDATASGSQFLAILTGDKKGASLCNLINTGKRVDLYTEIFNRIKDRIGSQSIARIIVKEAIMVSLYGSEAKPKELFGEENLPIFEEVMSEMMPQCWALNKYLLQAWDPKAIEYRWVMPDNFHVVCPVEVSTKSYVKFLGRDVEVVTKSIGTQEKGRALSANAIHSVDSFVVREMQARCQYNAQGVEDAKRLLTLGNTWQFIYKDKRICQALLDNYRKSGYMSARILEYVGNNTIKLFTYEEKEAILAMINTLPEKPFEVISIHDCYRCLPNYGNDLRNQYKQVLLQLDKSHLLAYMLNQILPHLGIDWSKTKVKQDSLYSELKNEEYALC